MGLFSEIKEMDFELHMEQLNKTDVNQLLTPVKYVWGVKL